MSGYRFMFDLFIPFEKGTKDIPANLKKDILIIRDQIVKLKGYAQKIEPTDPTGNRMIEDTDKAKFHICHHDENPTKPCEAEKDISELTAEKPTTIIKKPLKTSFLQKVWESIVRMWKALTKVFSN